MNDIIDNFFENVIRDCSGLWQGKFEKDRKILKKHLIMALKEQDRDTRHACAEIVIGMEGDMVNKDHAHFFIMNCRTGLNIHPKHYEE